MQEIMEWAYGKYGEEVYTDMKQHAKAVETHLEHEEIALSPKSRKELVTEATWRTQRNIMQAAQQIADKIGTDKHLDFNLFEAQYHMPYHEKQPQKAHRTNVS